MHVRRQVAIQSCISSLLYQICRWHSCRFPKQRCRKWIFLITLNSLHPSSKFTIEFQEKGILPYIGVNVHHTGDSIQTSVYRKPTNTGQLLHFNSYTDNRYKSALISTMVTRALRISSSWSHYHEECQRLNNIFHRLNYPSGLISSCIKTSLDKFHSSDKRTKADISSCTHRVSIPFKTQKACKAVKQSISRLSMRCDLKITAIFRSRNIASHVHNTEVKEDLVSKSNVVYKYICSCDKSYIGYTSRYLHQRVDEHAKPPSSIYLHCKTRTTYVWQEQILHLSKVPIKIRMPHKRGSWNTFPKTRTEQKRWVLQLNIVQIGLFDESSCMFYLWLKLLASTVLPL